MPCAVRAARQDDTGAGITSGELGVDLEVVPPEDQQHEQASQHDGSEGHPQHGDEDVALGSLDQDARASPAAAAAGRAGLVAGTRP